MTDYLNRYKDKVILITGGAGAIGSNLTRVISQLGAKLVIVLDNLSSAERWNIPRLPNVLFVEGDVRDEEKLKRVFSEKPQYVFHLAAFFANQNSIDHPETDLAVNGLGTLKLLQYSYLIGVQRFIYTSSGCSIYGSKNSLPLTEEYMSLKLSTPYQITKMLGELYCNFFHHHYGLPVVEARLFNSYGPGEIPGQYRNVIPNFTYWALRGEPLPITGSGEETRDFTYVADIVDGLLRAGYFEAAIGQAINLASSIETRITDLAQNINELAGNTAGTLFVPSRKWDTKKRLVASVAKAKELIGYEPRTELKTGLQNVVTWFRDNWKNIENAASFEPGMSSAVRNKGNQASSPA
ncbi:SDR family NAD(P)-dependent oxidoreductase [candidate division CSSED10-310 bacterium]|uniref:SDR family NAD(P)-dependent oxidoreductase n=1 Tax=candidate division CSSED10-310 bacterium TaxID=2855610 RepID=A0ABV6YVP9_UNCC1